MTAVACEPALDDLLGRLRQAPDDQAAWEALVVGWRPALLRLAQQITGSRALAEDAVQDALVRLGRGVARWQGVGGAFGAEAFVRGFVRTAAIDLRRSEQARGRREQAVAELSPTAAHPVIDDGDEVAEALRRILPLIPSDERRVLAQHLLNHEPLERIAAIDGTTLAEVRARYARGCARARLLFSGGALRGRALAALAPVFLLFEPVRTLSAPVRWFAAGGIAAALGVLWYDWAAIGSCGH